jgi:hypothetical protein
VKYSGLLGEKCTFSPAESFGRGIKLMYLIELLWGRGDVSLVAKLGKTFLENFIGSLLLAYSLVKINFIRISLITGEKS